MVKGLKVSGRMSVGRFEKEFEDEFGVKCQIKDCGKLADDNATLASLRPEDFKGPKVVDFSPSGNMLVKNVKKKFTKNFGANIQFYYKNRVVLEDITFGELQRGEVKKDNDPAESVNIEQNESVSSTNNRALTEEQINDLKNTEEKSTNSNDYRNLADDICEAGDKEWAIKVYKKAEEKAEDVDDLQALAESIAKTLGDKEWARKVYKKAEEKAEDSRDLHFLAESIAETLGDKEWATKLFKKAEEKAEDVDDLQALAESIAKTLGDKEWARKVYKKAEEKAEDVDDLQALAESIAKTLGDKEWARKVYKKAEEKAEDVDDLQALAESIAKTLGDKEWATKLFKKAEAYAETIREYIELVDAINRFDDLDDKEWVKGLKNEVDEKIKLISNELENSLKTSDSNYWLTNSCEDIGECFLKTRSFKPVDNYEEIIKTINGIYEDNRRDKNDTLFTISKYDDEIIIHGSTYLLRLHETIEESGIVDAGEKYIEPFLKNTGVPNYKWTNKWDNESSLWEYIISSSDNADTGTLLELLVAPNQKVTVQITDTEYGNSEFEIEK